MFLKRRIRLIDFTLNLLRILTAFNLISYLEHNNLNGKILNRNYSFYDFSLKFKLKFILCIAKIISKSFYLTNIIGIIFELNILINIDYLYRSLI